MKFKKDEQNNKNDKIYENNKTDYEKEVETRLLKKYRNTLIYSVALTTILVMTGIGLRMWDTIYGTYTKMQKSTYYNAIANRDNENDNLNDVVKLMNEIDNIYESTYVNSVDRADIEELVLNALIQAYGDKYGNYMNNQDSDEFSDELSNKLCGIGILSYTQPARDRYEMLISKVYEDSPAEKAGLKVGDIIKEINGNKLYKDQFENIGDIIYLIRGEKGTIVELTCLDVDTQEEKVVKVTRDNIETYPILSDVITDNIGIIRITGFEESTAKYFKRDLLKLKDKGINNIILDLRNNNGGLLTAARDTLNILLPEQRLFSVFDKNNTLVKEYTSDEEYIDANFIILINENTASAAELVAQSLKDNKNALVIGTTSFGKGTVCNTFDLSNGGSVMVSTNKYIMDSGYNIEGVGVKPDIEMFELDDYSEPLLTMNYDDDDLIQRAIKEFN